MPHKPGVGAIFGIVSEEGVAKPSSPVFLYDRTTGYLVAKTYTANDGGFVFNGLNPDTNDYYVVATDEDGSPRKNALIRDYVQPIRAHLGAHWWQNWQTAVSMLSPQALFSGYTDADGVPTTLSSKFYIYGSATVGGSITPGAPHAASVQFNDALAHFYTTRWLSLGDSRIPSQQLSSFEGAIDFSSLPVSFSLWGHFETENGITGFGVRRNLLFAVEVFSTIIKVFVGNRVALTYNHSYTGVHHVAVNLRKGADCKLYIDGNLVFTDTSESRKSATYDFMSSYYYYRCPLIAASVSKYRVSENSPSNDSANHTTAKIGPFAMWLDRLLTDQEIQDHYNYLFTPKTPILSGYQRAVMSLNPAWYYRLNEATSSDLAHDMVRYNDRLIGQLDEFGLSLGKYILPNTSSITFANPTPIVGGSGMMFNGGCVLVNQANNIFLQNNKAATFSFLYKISAAPSSNQMLFGVYDAIKNLWLIKLYVLGTGADQGKLKLIVRQNSDSNIIFNYVLPTGAWTWLAITLDVVAENAKLWGADMLTQSVVELATTAILPTVFESSWFELRFYDMPNYLHIGGIVNTSNDTISNAFIGGLSELAYFPSALTQGDLQTLVNNFSTP